MIDCFTPCIPESVVLNNYDFMPHTNNVYSFDRNVNARFTFVTENIRDIVQNAERISHFKIQYRF